MKSVAKGATDSEPQSVAERPFAEKSANKTIAASSSGQCVLKIEHVGHTYRNGGVALTDINLEVAKGEVVGLLGPNGAGKSSLLKISCGLMRPTHGTVTVLGQSLFNGDKDVKRRVCALLQQSPIEPNMRVREVLTLFSSFYAHPLPVDTLLAYVGMEDKKNAFIHTLSGGQRQRIAFARAMIGNPDILVLDEPTTGLDVSIRRELLTLINSLKKDGHSIVLSTHLVEEAEQVCDKVAIINSGRLFGYDTPARLISEFGSGDRLEVVFESVLPENIQLAFLPSITCQISPTPYHPYTYILFGAESETMFRTLAEVALSCHVPMLSSRLLRAGLESAYLNLTGKRIVE